MAGENDDTPPSSEPSAKEVELQGKIDTLEAELKEIKEGDPWPAREKVLTDRLDKLTEQLEKLQSTPPKPSEPEPKPEPKPPEPKPEPPKPSEPEPKPEPEPEPKSPEPEPAPAPSPASRRSARKLY